MNIDVIPLKLGLLKKPDRLTDEQAERLADAGLTAYNHNLDTSLEYYDQIITTRTYQKRLETLQQGAIHRDVCIGESRFDFRSLHEFLQVTVHYIGR